MSGRLIIDTIEPEHELTINGKLIATDDVIMNNIIHFEDDTIDDCSLVALNKSDNTITTISDQLLIPLGTVMSFAGPCDIDPPGWLLCDGRYLLIDENNKYFRLYQTIGKRWGTNDIETVFRIPDMRGRFIRGADPIGLNDPDFGDRRKLNDDGTLSNNLAEEVLGSYQDDAFQGHWHNWTSGMGGNYTGQLYSSYDHDHNPGKSYNNLVRDPVSDGNNETPRTSRETRSKNAAMNFIIKY